MQEHRRARVRVRECAEKRNTPNTRGTRMHHADARVFVRSTSARFRPTYMPKQRVHSLRGRILYTYDYDRRVAESAPSRVYSLTARPFCATRSCVIYTLTACTRDTQRATRSLSRVINGPIGRRWKRSRSCYTELRTASRHHTGGVTRGGTPAR